MVFNNFVPAMRLEKCSNKFHQIDMFIFNIAGSNKLNHAKSEKNKKEDRKKGRKRMNHMTQA